MYLKKRNFKLASLFATLFLLAGCVSRTSDGQPTGIIWDLLGKPMEQFLFWCADLFGSQTGRYGIAIILVTILIRGFIISPLVMKSMKSSTIQQERLALVQDEMTVLNEEMKRAATPEEKNRIMQEQMALRAAVGVKLLPADGCLPLLIQMPIISALYVAVSSSPRILQDVFFGISLAEHSMILMLISSALYFLQGLIMQIGMTPEQKKQGRSILIMNPLLNMLFALSAPAGAVLYWCVGGVFACLTSLYIVKVYKPRIKAEIEEELRRNPITLPKRKDVTPTAATTATTKEKLMTTRRNEGKQRR